MKHDENTCRGCLWEDSCNSSVRCEDYTPTNQESDILYYQNILKENDEEYRSVVQELNS